LLARFPHGANAGLSQISRHSFDFAKLSECET
jgi:hypothetical protein